MIDLSAQVLDATSEADRQKWRSECRRSLYFFCKAVLGFSDFTPDLHRDACAFVQAQGARRKKFMLPRFFFKSHIGTIGYPLWLILQAPAPPAQRVTGGFYGPDERILILNAAEQNSKHFLGKIKSIVEGNAVFQWLFPELIPDFSSKNLTWNELESSIVRPVDYPEPTFTAAGANAHITSRHFTRIICDDLIDEHHADSPDLMNKAIENFGRYEPLLVTLDHEITVIGTRWAFNDLYSWLDKNDGTYDPNERAKGWLTYLRSAIEHGKPIFPQRLPLHEFERLRKTRGAYYVSCNPAEAPVLMADWSCKPIAQITVGDTVVGFTMPTDTTNTCLTKTTVLDVGSRMAPVYRVTMKSGRVIRCTEDHHWFTGRYPSTDNARRRTYAPASIGRKMVYVCQPYFPPLDAGAQWLAGIYDGEGSCNSQSGRLSLSQSPTKNPDVHVAIEQALKRYDFDFSTSMQPSGYGGDQASIFLFAGEFEERRRFLLQCQPVRRQAIIESLYQSRWGTKGDYPVQITYDRDEPVFSFQTGTGNYIVWGYASRNCLFQNEPRSPEVNVFQDDWLNWYTFDSRNHLVTEDGKVHNPANMQRVVVIDIATGKTSKAAYSAVVAAAMDDTRKIFILEAWHGRVRTKELVNRAIKYAAKWHADIKYEAYGQQKLLEDPLNDAAAMTGQYINVEPINAGVRMGAVDTQIEIFGRLCENGQVYCRRALTEFLTEYRDYPLGEFKDMLAAVSYTPKVFMFSYQDVVDLDATRQKRAIAVNLIHARPGLADLDKVARDTPDGAFERMLTVGGRSRVSGY